MKKQTICGVSFREEPRENYESGWFWLKIRATSRRTFSSGQPPGHRAPGREELRRALAGTLAEEERRNEADEHGNRDDDPVDEMQSHDLVRSTSITRTDGERPARRCLFGQEFRSELPARRNSL